MSLFLTNVPDPPAAEDPVSLDPARPPRRIPNLAHALLFVSFAGLLLILIQVVFLALGILPTTIHAGAITVQHPKLQIAMQTATYLTTLLVAWIFYPLVWKRAFVDGLQWRWTTARLNASKLIALGFLLSAMMQVLTYLITPPKKLPIDVFFLTPSNAWLITVFGTLVAPVFEEICFRGFLLPAFAIAYDWLSLPRTENALARWQATTSLTPLGLIFSAILTSILFAMMHFQQDAHMWAVMLVLFSVSLALTFVRIKTQSVAASAVVHAAYNLFDFLLLFIATGGYRHLDRMSR
ncbi:MAG TPA: CPBP family intramembrane glutamic endopeptidase [Acidobacteriaceae bacterium]